MSPEWTLYLKEKSCHRLSEIQCDINFDLHSEGEMASYPREIWNNCCSWDRVKFTLIYSFQRETGCYHQQFHIRLWFAVSCDSHIHFNQATQRFMVWSTPKWFWTTSSSWSQWTIRFEMNNKMMMMIIMVAVDGILAGGGWLSGLRHTWGTRPPFKGLPIIIFLIISFISL